jgi:hypothetical protein
VATKSLIVKASCVSSHLARHWRKGWDSNPRWSCPHGGFQDRCLKPLGHPSKPWQTLKNLPLPKQREMARCHRSATQSTGTPVYGRPQGGVNLRRGVLLQPRPHGGVQVARDADAGVTPALLRDLGVAAARQPLCRLAVPQVVEATRRAGPLFVPFARVPRWVCRVLSTIAGGPAATSRALRRSAVTSARRKPQSAPGRTGVNIRVGRKSANRRAGAWASRARIVVVSTFVPPTAPAGLRPRIRHVRAWLVPANACRVRRWPAPEN